MLIVALILFVAVIVIITINPLPEKIFGGYDYPEIQAIQEEIHRYSGVNEEYYMAYYTNMDMAKKTQDDGYFREAIENLRNMALMIEEPDSEVPGEINELANRLSAQWLKK